MIRKDFETGGFPINRRNPILCLSEKGMIYPAYDRFNLRKILTKFKIVKCLGIWPGLHDTDIFVLNANSYGQIIPPEEYRHIDSCSDIIIYLEENGKLKEIRYADSKTKEVEISTSQELANYIIKAGIKHIVKYKAPDHI